MRQEKHLKLKANKNFISHQIGDAISTEADTKKLNSLINFLPKTDINIGIKNFIKWYKNYHSI